ncbi:MAG: hypothetical protein ACLUCU_06075 [Slackia sp.]
MGKDRRDAWQFSQYSQRLSSRSQRYMGSVSHTMEFFERTSGCDVFAPSACLSASR